MRIILSLVRKDLLNFTRFKGALILTFAIPFMMIWLFGQVFGVNSKDSGPSGIPVAVVNASSNPGAAKLVDALKAEKSFRIITDYKERDGTKRPLTEADLRPMMQAAGSDLRFALVLPADLVSDTSFGLHLKFLSNPRSDIETQMVNGLLQKAIFTNVPELLGQSLQARAKKHIGEKRLEKFNDTMATAISAAFNEDKEQVLRRIESGDFGISELTKSAASSGTKAGESKPTAADFIGKIVRIENEQVVGAQVKSPMATRLVGGWAIQFLLFAVSASAAGLFRERDAGIFQRLLAAPVTRAHILWSKFLYGVTLGLIQLLVLFVASSFMFHTDVLSHVVLLSLVCVLAAAACSAFGMLLASIAGSPESASGLSTLVIMLMSLLGGAWFPLGFMPSFMQQFSKLTIVYWSMEGFSAVLWAGNSFGQILPILGVLAGMTGLVLAVAVWRFNRGSIFG